MQGTEQDIHQTGRYTDSYKMLRRVANLQVSQHAFHTIMGQLYCPARSRLHLPDVGINLLGIP